MLHRFCQVLDVQGSENILVLAKQRKSGPLLIGMIFSRVHLVWGMSTNDMSLTFHVEKKQTKPPWPWQGCLGKDEDGARHRT